MRLRKIHAKSSKMIFSKVFYYILSGTYTPSSKCDAQQTASSQHPNFPSCPQPHISQEGRGYAAVTNNSQITTRLIFLSQTKLSAGPEDPQGQDAWVDSAIQEDVSFWRCQPCCTSFHHRRSGQWALGLPHLPLHAFVKWHTMPLPSPPIV